MSIETMLATLGSVAVAQWLGAWVTVSLKGSVLIVVAWMLTRALRRGSAAMRHAIWTSALAGMLVLPVLAGIVPVIELGGLPEIRLPRSGDVEQPVFASAAEPVEQTVDRAAERLPSAGAAVAASMRDLETAMPSPKFTAHQPVRRDWWLPFALILGVALLVVRAVAGAFQLSVWTRGAGAVHDADWLSLAQRLAYGMGISRPVTLLRSKRACVPMTWGVVYPIVLLPADADAWTSDRRTIVLLHELAHVKRLDALTQFIAQVSVAVFWFNPIVWFAARQMRIEREHACDDFVLDAGARASDYANDLLQIARSLVTSGAPAAAALAMARRTELEGRLLAILNPRANRRRVSRKRLVASSLGVFALALPLAALRPAAAPETRVILSEAKDRFRAKAGELPRGTAILRSPVAALRLPQDDARGPVAALRLPQDDARGPVAALRLPQDDARGPVAALRLPQDDARGPVAALRLPQDDTRGPHVDIAESVASSASLPPVAALQFMPATPAITVTPSPAVGLRFSRTPATRGRILPDLETLIAVARAAKKLTSDFDKAELLITVVNHYVSDDELRTAYLDAVASLTSDYERSRTLAPLLLKDSLPMKAVAQVVKIASMMTSGNEKANIVARIAREHPSLTPPIRAALIAMATTMTSDYDRERAIGAIARRGGLSNAEAVDLIAAAKGITSSYSKANTLLVIAARHPLSDTDVRRAYLSAAETISSASDYRRAIARMLD